MVHLNTLFKSPNRGLHLQNVVDFCCPLGKVATVEELPQSNEV